MRKTRNGFIKNIRYLCLIGVIALGLITIVGTGGGTALLKVDPSDHSYEQILPTASEPTVQYSIYKMTVSENDEVDFNAQRMSDFAKIIGRIDSLNNVSMIDETVNQEVIVLERIR